MTTKTYYVPVYALYNGYATVEADSLSKAKQLVDSGLSIDRSWVDREIIGPGIVSCTVLNIDEYGAWRQGDE